MTKKNPSGRLYLKVNTFPQRLAAWSLLEIFCSSGALLCFWCLTWR